MQDTSPEKFPSRAKPAEITKDSWEALFDLWTPPSQKPLCSADARQWNANQRGRSARSKQRARSAGPGKTLNNGHVTRRKAVLWLAAGGVAAVGITVSIDLAANSPAQQVPNNVANLPENAAMNFVNPSNGKASVIVHLPNGSFAAYDRACTHAGVYVKYDPGKRLFVCPAHGATFNPALGGAVKQGPATKPLPIVVVHINTNGTITA